MNGFAFPRAASAKPWILAGSLLLAATARGGETPGIVQVSDEDPSVESRARQSAQYEEVLASFTQEDAPAVTPVPYSPSLRPEQFARSSQNTIRANYGPPCEDPPALPPVPPNMIGDFFGAIANRTLLLPGDVVDQAIFMQPPVDPLDETPPVDHLRSVTVTGIGTFQTNAFVYLATSNGQPTGVVPTRVPRQLLQQYDGSLFVGDVDTLGAVTDPGPFLVIDSGTIGDVATGAPLPAAVLIDEPIFNIHDTFTIFVPSPGTGGGVGRQKIAENSSPIPRDRVFLDYSMLSGVPLTSDGINVHRFTPGIEKTFLDQWFSIELRLPFASTLDANVGTQGILTDTESTEFGNIVGTFKALVRRTPTTALAVGVSVTAPTAKGMTASDVTGAPFLSIENQSVHVMPFIGGLHTRGRAFGQWFVQGDVDSTGSDVELRNFRTGVYGHAGTMQDASFLYVSGSFGYWLYQDGQRDTTYSSSPGRTLKRTVYTGGGITGIAPTVEFHYNRSLTDGDTIRSGPVPVQGFGDFELTNLVLGAVMTFGSGGSLTASWGTPILGQDDKQFDQQARLAFNYEY